MLSSASRSRFVLATSFNVSSGSMTACVGGEVVIPFAAICTSKSRICGPAVDKGAGIFCILTVNQKWLPIPPSFGSNSITPPMSSVRDLEMERPRPVPLYRFVVVLSNCVKGVKRCWRADECTPIPESITSVFMVY